MKKFLFLLIFICLFSNFVNADFQKTEIYVNEDGSIDFIEDYLINEDLDIDLPEDYYNFNINLNDYELEENKLFLHANQETDFEVKYSTSKFSYKEETIWSLFVDFEGLDNNFISVYLPKNAKLLDANEGAEIYTLGGEIIIDLKDVDNLDISYELTKTSSGNYLWIFYVIIFGIIGTMGLLLKKKFVKSKKNNLKEVIKEDEDIMSTLNDTEKKIVKVLMENKRLTQKKILFLTGLPKSTLSRTLRRLQRKNIIEIKRVGISNVVYLKDWFKG